MKVYCVRQKSTGLFIPRLETGKRRGGSHLEPSNEREPRIFHNKAAASAFISTWVKGIYKPEDFYLDTQGNEVGGGLEIEPQPHRKKDDMEIVEFYCFENESVQLFKDALKNTVQELLDDPAGAITSDVGIIVYVQKLTKAANALGINWQELLQSEGSDFERNRLKEVLSQCS